MEAPSRVRLVLFARRKLCQAHPPVGGIWLRPILLLEYPSRYTADGDIDPNPVERICRPSGLRSSDAGGRLASNRELSSPSIDDVGRTKTGSPGRARSWLKWLM